jgi:putative endonuclease
MDIVWKGIAGPPHAEKRAVARISKDRGQNDRRGLPLYSSVFRWEFLHRDDSNGTEIRIAQHNAGTFKGYTESRRPVKLIFSQWFDRITDAIESERKLKKWSRAKKEAFIRGDMTALQQLAKRRSPHPSRRPPAAGSSEGENVYRCLQ